MAFPHYKQYDSMDCGPTCLQIIASYYGKFFTLSKLRELCYVNREGVSMLGVSDAAISLGFRTVGVKISLDELINKATLPCIVHLNRNHYVVVYKVTKKKIYVSDPGQQLMKYSIEEFSNQWLKQQGSETPVGFALLFEPTPKFYSESEDESKKFNFRYIFKYLRPYKAFIVQIFLSLLLSSGIGLIMPFMTQSIVDVGIGTGNSRFVLMILIAQMVLTFGQMANSLIRNWLMLHVTTRMSISIVSDFLIKLMKLPISFFDSKNVGDIIQRIGDSGRIQSFLTGSLISIIMAVVTFIIYSIVMTSYSLRILGIFLLGSILYVGWIALFLKRRRKLDFMRFQEAASSQNNIVQLVSGMQDIKLNNCEGQKLNEWENIQGKLYNISIKGLTLGQTQIVGGSFIDQIKNLLISYIAASSVIDGTMTLGMMTAMQYVIGQLNAPIANFISFVQSTQDAKISMERLGEVHEKDDIDIDDDSKSKEIPANSDLTLNNVVFQYNGPRSNKVIDNISFNIPANKVTAIVGKSGSGKTSLLKLILGFYLPSAGSILLGNKPLHQYNRKVWRSKCGAVMQESYIFSDTILGNIAISDRVANIERAIQAAKVANIHDFIAALPLGYFTKIGAEGVGLSTGQKQRILIARAVYKNAEYIIFDEATNSLDTDNENVIMNNLSTFFKDKTVVIVAHRMSTIKNADNIIVLEDGKIAEQGNHEQLLQNKGVYYNLIKSQL